MFRRMFLTKLRPLLLIRLKFLSMHTLFLGTRPLLLLRTNGLILWFSWMMWIGTEFIVQILNVPLKPNYAHFISNFFTELFVQNNFFIKLVELILPTVNFV